MGYLYKLIRFTKRTCLTCAINSISLYSPVQEILISICRASTNRQSRFHPIANKILCCSRFKNFNTSSNPSPIPVRLALWPPPTHRVKLHEGVSDVHRGPALMFLPFDLFLVASRIDLRDSPLEISRGRKREWAKQFGEGGGDSSVASFRLTISVGRLHSDLFGRTRTRG